MRFWKKNGIAEGQSGDRKKTIIQTGRFNNKNY